MPLIIHFPTGIPKREPRQNPKKNNIRKIVLLEIVELIDPTSIVKK
tara:strand:+ start:1048 stop:1185 length:138 start_codon:yes stop_codon:yes gene_type:complete